MQFRLRFMNLILGLAPRFSFNRVRTRIYQAFGWKIGTSSIIMGTMDIAGNSAIRENLQIGNECVVTTPIYLDLNAKITVGNCVAIGHHVSLITSNHDTSNPLRRCGKLEFSSIRIEDGCWIGAGATILAGVTVSNGSVVAAGALVTRDVPPNVIVGGVPAKVIRNFSKDSQLATNPKLCE